MGEIAKDRVVLTRRLQTRAELEQENAKIQGELTQVKARLLYQESVLDSKNAFIEQLKESLILARNRNFAAATESLRSLQSELFNGPE